MKYVKPQITLLASATDAIQTDQQKLFQNVYDLHAELATSIAYEADE